MALKKISEEVGRKGFHLSSLILLIVFIYLEQNFSRQLGMFALVLIFSFALFLEFLRIDLKMKPPFLNFFWKRFKRKKEIYAMGSEIFQIAGIMITLAAYDLRIATAAILMIIFSDPAAALVGKTFGKHKLYKKKTYEGTTAGLITNLIIGFIVIRANFISLTWFIFPTPFGEAMWIPLIGMAITATVTELFVDKIDDNLAVPIMTGLVGQILLYVI